FHLESLTEGDWLNLRRSLENFITPPGVSGSSMTTMLGSVLPVREVRELQHWLRANLTSLVVRGVWSVQVRTTYVLRWSPIGLSDWTLPPGTVPTAEAF